MDEDSSAYTAYSSGGTAEQVLPKSEDWSYLYTVPSDCLRILEVNDDPAAQWELNDLGMLCNEADVSIVYVKQVTDVSLYSSEFTNLLVARLAYEMAMGVTGSKTKTELMFKLYVETKKFSANIDAKEIKTNRHPVNKYADARR
jgi:hypothetical protein